MKLDSRAIKLFAGSSMGAAVVVGLLAGGIHLRGGTPFQAWHALSWSAVLAGAVLLSLAVAWPLTRRGRAWQEAERLAAWRREERAQGSYEPSHEAWLDPERQDPRRWVLMNGTLVYTVPGECIVGEDSVEWEEEGRRWCVPCMVRRGRDGEVEWNPAGDGGAVGVAA